MLFRRPRSHPPTPTAAPLVLASELGSPGLNLGQARSSWQRATAAGACRSGMRRRCDTSAASPARTEDLCRRPGEESKSSNRRASEFRSRRAEARFVFFDAEQRPSHLRWPRCRVSLLGREAARRVSSGLERHGQSNRVRPLGWSEEFAANSRRCSAE